MTLLFFKNHTIKVSVDNVDQQLRRYLTACENEKATYRIVEDAISERLIPIVENMMSDDAMEGGVHPMKHHTYQGSLPSSALTHAMLRITLLREDSFMMNSKKLVICRFMMLVI